MEKYKNKIVVISGGLGDIGSAIALAFGKKGAKVAISDLFGFDDAKHRVEELRSKGCTDLSYHKVDVVSESEITAWIDAVEKEWGLPQIIVPNAGIVIAGSLTGDDLSTDDVKKQLDVNFWGSYHLAVQASKRIRAKGLPGRITFIGSWAAERPNARISAYCISKASIRMLCKTMALELAAYDILVNEIAPGIVEGGLSKKNQQKDPELLKLHLKSTPTRKLVSVDEIAAHVLRLSDFEYNNLTGTTLTVDGGLSLTSKMTQ
ncbi:SDR family oxidoreductase [Daejeonella sp.]|uniref:SDR family NAD(P)-dependent oxidoreductase n=1 Tax=Daejeonella sp. TaxID=2805397 RepID=UPI0030BB7E2E